MIRLHYNCLLVPPWHVAVDFDHIFVIGKREVNIEAVFSVNLVSDVALYLRLSVLDFREFVFDFVAEWLFPFVSFAFFRTFA